MVRTGAELSQVERAFLEHPPRVLARVATVGRDGMPHVVPCGWSFDPTRNVIVLGGRDVSATSRFRHVLASEKAAVVIDGLREGAGWSPWAVAVRGRAQALVGPPAEIIVFLDEVRSWGLSDPQAASTGQDGSPDGG
ncbi:MAG: pyridoxamine 5'-phosphate oxidase family protein [Actinomycetota bacterium]|nr:pyridoxamine 5'-phosphate oxidase family protein [Actinomycetota bacterium]